MLGVLNFPDIGSEIFSVSLFGLEFALRWYALAYIAGLLIGWRIVVAAVRRPALWPAGRAPMSPGQVDDLLTWIILGVILGGRLGFVLFYQPGHYLANPVEIPMIWRGGMSFHGGLAGVCIALALFARRNGVPLLSAADALALAAPVGLFFGRIANFINAELWGQPSDLPWAVVFPGPLAQDCPGWEMVPCARHPSQLYEAGLEGLVLGLVLVWLVRARGALRRPGFLTGIFFMGYGFARIFVELFREADPQFVTPDNPLGHVLHLGGAGLSMGQLLSLPMVGLGLLFLLLSRRRA
ncbi:prolipoprotein diacylglyceryl transferase [Rhodovulum strictum]|uniref:Phosphatidylglycerol--prolipoprotein diacylglyceryl transferase n=1 Tax=Rhodovulum strictum TaxID=58314 RepID=A0A844B939_9RHOB|nr:prolipoprotein diacylglyceryl transferase [Rhodovulum strictum]MRH22851.1 prolipoprotein diacylglyceryl transferase [Rhodovulum strictum]